jgi:hypothetical protein
VSSKTNRNEKANERRAAIEAIRKEQQAKERRRAILGAAAVGAVLVVLVVLIVIGTRPKHAGLAKAGPQILPTAVTSGTTTVEKPIQKVANTTGINGVIAYNTTGWPGNGNTGTGAFPHNHVQGPVKYSVLPPAGGDHSGTWMNAGVYTAPVPSERAVHDLEHGAVWITYRPNLPASQVQAIEKFVGDQTLIDEGGNNSNRYMIASPWADNTLPAPIVLSAWGYQLYVTSPTDPRMQQFVSLFRHNQKYTPEYGSAADGIPVNAGAQQGQLGGGQPALYGSKYANPKSY